MCTWLKTLCRWGHVRGRFQFVSETRSSWWIGALPSCSICGSMTQPCPQGALHASKNTNSCALSFSNQTALGCFGADQYFDEKQPMCGGCFVRPSCDFRAPACACVRLRAPACDLRAPSCDLRAPSCAFVRPSCAFVRPSCSFVRPSCAFVRLRVLSATLPTQKPLNSMFIFPAVSGKNKFWEVGLGSSRVWRPRILASWVHKQHLVSFPTSLWK